MRGLLLTLLLSMTACGLGPRQLRTDRVSYTEAIASSWKTQMLLNIVKLRYMDAPVFLDVQQILAGYTAEGSASAGWSNGGFANGLTVGGAGRYTERPTITYRPVSGSEFAKNFMTPIPPSAIFYLIQAGFAADYVFPLCVQSINGLNNYSGAKSMRGPADERFIRLVKVLAKAQRHGALGMRVVTTGKRTATVLFFPRRDSSPEVQALVDELGELLHLDKGLREFTVEYSTAPGGKDTIVMLTRSALTIMFELAVQIDVPPEHAEAGYTVPAPPVDESLRLIRIHSGTADPGDIAFVRAKHENHFFWIRKDDLPSKRTFSFLRLLFGFVDKGAPLPPTLLTVPTS